MTHFPVSDIRKAMGKPPLNRESKTVQTQIRMTQETRARIEAVAGENKMASFIRDAIENELQRREKSSRA